VTRVDLSAHGFRLSVAPDFGANITGMDWIDETGRWVSILRSCGEDQLVPHAPSPVGCFPMAPFANRIDGGNFAYGGRTHRLPVNRPDENVAIHGLSRFEPFERLSQTDSSLRLLHRCRRGVFSYDLVQTIQLDPSGVSVRLTILNRGDRMPFGLGLHPYFVREEAASLQFHASSLSQADERHLPSRFISSHLGPSFAAGARLEGLDDFDGHYAGWKPRRVALKRPGAGIRVSLSATEAFSNLHVYVPPGGDTVCIEPVSHVPNVHNQTKLASFGTLVELNSGDALSGSMHVSVSRLTA
jgi:aldose 1-epimerase